MNLSKEFCLNAGLDDRQWVLFLKKWLGLSLVLHWIAGLISIGFYDMDEHFQLMEFVSYKLGRSPITDLAHEYGEHIRSFFQPTLYEAISRMWLMLGIDSPSTWACSFRLLSATLGWVSLVGVSLCSYRWIEKKYYRELAVKFAALLYFLPYIQARPSGESLGGSFLFIALSFFYLTTYRVDSSGSRCRYQLSWRSSFVTGILMGLSFLCRFQMGFALFGFALWWPIGGKLPLKKAFHLVTGFLLVLLFGVILDWRAYGVWTFTGWDYFRVAFLDGVAASTGVYPWWFYFQYLKGDVPLIGNLVAAGVIAGWAARPTHVLTFTTGFFFLGHVLAAHKEPRYLFPLVSGVPVLLALGCQWLKDQVLRKRTLKNSRVNAGDSSTLKETSIFKGRLDLPLMGEDCADRAFNLIAPLKWAAYGLIALNIGGLVVATTKPAAVQPKWQSYVFNHSDEIHKLYYYGGNPFQLIGLPMNFYRPPHLTLENVPDLVHAEKALPSEKSLWLFYPHYELPEESKLLRSHCELKYSVFSEAMKSLLFIPGIRYSNKGSIFKCTLRESDPMPD